MAIPQDRWRCPHCGASGWWTPSSHIGLSPLTDHNRPDGRRCKKAMVKGCSECRSFARLKADRNLPTAGDTYCSTCGAREADVARDVKRAMASEVK